MSESRDAAQRTTVADWIPDPHTIEQLFDASPVPMVITSLLRDCVLAVNARATEVFGVPKEEAVGGPVTRYYADESERERVIAGLRTTGRVDDVPLRLQRPDGTPVWAITSGRRVVWKGEPAILSAFVDITRQTTAEQALATSEHRLAAQSNAVTTLTERSAEGTIRFDDRIREILRVASETLDAERVSVWRFDDSHEEIRCDCLFRRSGAHYDTGARIPREMWPPYFEALETERVIAAHDAHRDSRTVGFRDGYLVPNGIGSMLDVPLRRNQGTLGVLCTEHVGGPRIWTLDEQNFALSVANLIAVAVADEERRRALRRLAESEARANLIVDTAHDAFIGIDALGRIVHWNAQAASTFGWTRAEAIGRNVAETIIPPGYRGAHTAGMQRFHETGEAPVVNRRLELSALHRSGREFPIELTITSPIQGESGVFFGAFLRDISARKEHDDQLRHAKESAERSRDSLDRELTSAGKMQQLLLPASLPSHGSMKCVAYYRTSRHAGGDYYDVLPAGDNRFALVVADVSGHGASAAIVMAMIRAVLHSDDSACRAPNSPPAVLHLLNRHFRYLWDTAMYATSIVGMFDVKARTLQMASAGHPTPLLIRGGQVSQLPVSNGPSLFWDEIDDIPCLEEELRPGDRVVFYTDGITDRRAADDSLFDLPRMIDALTNASELEIDRMVEHLVTELDTFGGEMEPDDDQTLLVIGIEE
jgi:PAS domain S-box-containing protein